MKKRPSETFGIKAAQINDLRRDLNGYVRALHRQWPAGLSLYDCFARYASISYAGKPVKIALSVISSLTPPSLADAEMAVARFAAICRLCGSPSAHPLAGIGLKEYRSTLKSEAYGQLKDLDGKIALYQQALRKLSDMLRHDFSSMESDVLPTLREISRILRESDYIPAGLFAAAGNNTVDELIVVTLREGRERDRLRDELLKLYYDDILSWDFREWENKWHESLGKWWLPKLLGCRSVRSQIRKYLRNKQDITPEDVGSLFALLEAYHRQQDELQRLGCDVAPLLGLLWRPERADWNRIGTVAAYTFALNANLLRLTVDTEAAAEMKKLVCRNIEAGYDVFRDRFVPVLDSVIEAAEAAAEQTDAVAEMLGADGLAAMPLDLRRATAVRWADNIESLHDRVTYNQELANMIAIGFRRFANVVDAGKIEVTEIENCFSKSLYRAYAEFILSKEPGLNRFHSVMFDEKIEMFRRFSHDLERLTREELFARLSSSLPALRREASLSSEVGILQRNIRNGGRGTSIRRLFDQIPDLLTRMCPCMLMSPISVAQYIDAEKVPFDLVIFDEASQMPTSEAVGAIARGRNVIVVGDPKQMPPTTFFTANVFDEDNVDKEDMENILEDCLALSMPSRHLLWHYRSRHESLIAFSNANYYDNKLLTFPSPDDLTTKVGWQYIEGTYERGKSRQNRAEAEAVIREISQRLSDPATAGQSIGVVTFNSSQQSLIEDMLTDMFSSQPELEVAATELEEPIFIKNLENVQGDERDVILFSIGYGPDCTGKIALNFGPLNREGGGRRLNVAVSRARYEMKVFSSLRAEDIDLNRSSAEGVADLKAFLEYAQKGRDCLAVDRTAEPEMRDSLVEAVASELTARGYTVRTHIGCSGYRIDIGVVDPQDPDRYLIGILLDGRRYAAAGTAGDRVVTQEAVLRQLGWQLWRVWSMDWWDNPDRTVENIIKAIDRAAEAARVLPVVEPEKKPAPLPQPMSAPTPDEPATAPAPAEATPAKAEEATDTPEEIDRYAIPYRTCRLKKEHITSAEFISGAYDPAISGRIMAVMDAEAPISKSLLYKRVVSSMGVNRMGQKVMAHMDKLVSRKDFKHTGTGDFFYWKQGQKPVDYANYRPQSDREALDIPPEEITVAIRRMLEDQVSLPPDSLKKEVAQLFGFRMMRDNVLATIDRAIGYAIKRKRIVLQDDRFRLP